MNSKKILYFAFLLFIISCKSEKEKFAAQPISPEVIVENAVNQFEKSILKDKIDSVFSKYHFNGSVAVLKGENMLYQKSEGFQNFKDKAKLDSNSVFAIASISKQFTAVLILLQEDQVQLNTEDKVSKYLKGFEKNGFENISIKNLLNHTSGISDSGNGLLSKPGEKFHYSNKGYRLLGEIIEKVSGKSYDENALELFKKVGMTNSSTANLSQGNHLAGAFLGNSKKFQEIVNMPKRLANKEISVPAGGILTTVSDLHLWNTKLYGGQILKPETLKKMTEKSADRNHPVFGKMEYGFGIMINTAPRSYFHSGYVKGAPSLNIYYPETKTSVIILSNIANEAIGKNAIFNPHKEIKKITDSAQNKVVELRTEMLKPLSSL
ncbi:serine hydrolase domain-containing protein [Kaistella jeonii]|uniref:serine hydrolase domain-containing protein n=1 Tax=Kaistella jeonii TaxID=266749 RepID=UPI000691D044|nr:serine hydrolase domain-containing protein [Kaistella jeonii]SFB87794.1 CubicO group peptidase, beta-lactamase class C family [Kaistella jeonii]VEI95943.1 Penicillin-binding protein E [Kaistella jeonii]